MLLRQALVRLAAAGLLLPAVGALAAGKAPTIAGDPPARVIAGQQWYFEPDATDPENDKLTFKVINKPRWATFWTGRGRLFGTPSAADVGTFYNVIIEVSDGTSTRRLPAFSITVDPTWVSNKAPTISGSPKTSIDTGKWYKFAPTASDPDDHALNFSISNKPDWATFTAATGVLSGRPAESDVRFWDNIVIRVTDGKATRALPAFSINVKGQGSVNPPGNKAPVISGDPDARVIVGNKWFLKVVATDGDGDPLTYSIRNKPSWMTFWNNNGRLFGTPSSSDVGIHDKITIEVSDGKTTVALPAFSIRVDSTSVSNRAPSIGGTPRTSVDPGRWYDFTPNASDPDGHALNFSISNKPSWAKFDPMTGRMFGRPQAGDVGAYSNIVIRATDGAATRSMSSFTINVGTQVKKSVTLNWTPPTKNTDGSSLNDLTGYRIYYGTSQGNYPNRIVINNAGVSSYVVENLSPGTYYFVSTAVNSQGVESDYSNVAQKVVN